MLYLYLVQLQNELGAGEKIFESVFNSTCTSNPITVSKFIVIFPPKFEEFVYGNLLLAHKHVPHDKSSTSSKYFPIICNPSGNPSCKSTRNRNSLVLLQGSLELLKYHLHTSSMDLLCFHQF